MLNHFDDSGDVRNGSDNRHGDHWFEGDSRGHGAGDGHREYDEVSGDISPVYSEMIRYDDIVDFDSKYVNIDGFRGIWIYRNSDMRLEDTLNATKGLDTVVGEVRDIVFGREVTSYNVGFDFGKFLYREPWNIRNIVTRKVDIMKLATTKVYKLADSDSIEDKELQERLLREREDSYYPEKWVRS